MQKPAIIEVAPPRRSRCCSPPRSALLSGHYAGHKPAGRARTTARRPTTRNGTGPGPLAGTSSHTGSIVMGANWRTPAGLHTASARLPVEGELPSFDGATGWLNSPPLTPAGLRGKVVLVNFWTYTCINWLRQLPYVRAWAEKYAGHGLVVIGVHTPEFAFEHDPDNVRRAVQEMRIDYPVAIDNDYAVWRAFDNHYWPALYFADAQGRIRHHHFGEGEYAAVGDGHPAAAGRGRTDRRRTRPGVGRRPRRGGPGRLGQPAIAGELHRLRAHRELRVPRRRRAGQAARLCRPGASWGSTSGPCPGTGRWRSRPPR